MSIFLKWGIPAFVTVVGGTAAAVATAGAGVPSDLASRTDATLTDRADQWAAVSFDMRDATITGTATTQEMIDQVVAKVAAVHGVRSVTSRVVLAEYVSPFPFIAMVDSGVLKLSGGLPDEAARSLIVAAAGEGAIDGTRLMSGAPSRKAWVAAVDYALDYARELDEGEVALADLQLTVSGRAKSSDAFVALGKLAEAVPAGVSLAYHEFQPPLRTPFEWKADYDGHRLVLSGAAPSEALTAEITDLAPAGTPVSASVALASGEPAGFAERAKALTENLLKLESGSATISDATSTLVGSPPSPAVAESVRVAMTPGGTVVTLGPPNVGEYWFSAERKDGRIVLDGFVPDEAMLERLKSLDGIDATGLELGRGAPERFVSGVDYVVDALRHMSEGHATIQGTVISIDGRATTTADYAKLETTLDLGAPQGLMLAATTVKPPLATPFTFAAEKTAAGAFSLTGYVPSSDARKAFVKALPGGAADTTVIADGNPADFEMAAVKALGVLPLLDTGKIAYDGAGWSLTGAVDTPQEAFAAEAAFAATGLRSAGWTYSVTLPAAEQAAALPVIDPYSWRAQKAAGGPITLAGFLPTEQLKRYLVGHAGSGVVDGTALGAGAPERFIPSAIAGLDALLAMEEGVLTLSGGDWSLSGGVAEAEDRYRLEAALGAAVDISGWHVAIQVAGAAPVVSPFAWGAAKSADGSIKLFGYVPTEEFRRYLAVHAAKVSADTTLVGSGEPENFIPDATAALDALMALNSGEAKYDGRIWSIAGQPQAQADLKAAEAALSGASNAAAWVQNLAEPLVTEPDAPAEATATAADSTPAVEPGSGVADGEAGTGEAIAPDTAIPAASESANDESPAETDVAELAAPPAEIPPAAPVPRSYRFDGKKLLGGPVAFEGSVPAEPMRRHLAVITGSEPNEALAIDAGLPSDFIVNADAGSRALALLADGEFGFDGDKWVLSGRAESEADRQAALTALAAVPALDKWQADVALLPPLLVCEDKVGAFAARNAILFQSGSTKLADGSQAAIDELAGYLALCPEATVNVEGHTDSDGDDDANLALSVSRAEAVVDALVQRGVGPDRLYAIGYGESLPIASNETKAGKQANRRIAFTLSDD